MDLAGVIERIYLPLLTQETAVMVSTFTYGLKAGLQPPTLIAANTAAIVTDLGLFFVPAYAFSSPLHGFLLRRYPQHATRALHLANRAGAFRAALAMGFMMPSVTGMLSSGVLRLAFWRVLAGLFIGSMAYVVIPLVLALPLAASLPAVVLPILPWIGPVLAIVVVLAALIRLRGVSNLS